MLFSDITILDENFDVREHMYVGVKGNRIAYIGSEKPEEDYGEIYEGRNRLLMTAFYNAHAHSSMTLMRGYGENMALNEWLNDRIFPFEDHLYADAVYYGTLLSMAESVRFGIVSSSDMYYFCDDIIRAVTDSGMKANISRSVSSFEEGSIKNGVRYKESEELLKHHNEADGRIKADISIHSEYTNTETSIREVAELAKESGSIMNVHISETRDEHESCKRKYGLTPIQLMEKCGAFDVPAIAAHCVWVEDADMDIMAEKGVTVATCPVSNLKLSSGVCNIPALMKKGINVAIGTDSVTSNNSLNFIEEIKFFALLSKERFQDPTLITPREALRAATLNGAKAQGRTDCGALKQGNKADLIVLDISQPHWHPVYDICTNLVYSASGSDVILTMADGKVLYRDGIWTTIDIEKTAAEVNAARKKILSEL